MNRWLQWLPLISVAVASSIAWGTQVEKVNNLEQAMLLQQRQQERINQLQAQGARVDERTAAIKQMLEQQQQIMNIMLQRLNQQ